MFLKNHNLFFAKSQRKLLPNSVQFVKFNRKLIYFICQLCCFHIISSNFRRQKFIIKPFNFCFSLFNLLLCFFNWILFFTFFSLNTFLFFIRNCGIFILFGCSARRAECVQIFLWNIKKVAKCQKRLPRIVFCFGKQKADNSAKSCPPCKFDVSFI